MSVLQVLRVGDIDAELCRSVAESLSATFKTPCEVLPQVLDPAFAYHGERLQYHSSELLHRMQSSLRPETWRLLGLTAVDLYIPILTFVFGEAQMGGPCALASAYRLRPDVYGMSPDPATLRERLLKEAIHELGHTLDLTHCEDYRCAMASSHSVERIDLKEANLCVQCRQHVAPALLSLSY